jgi:hypothetical protein
MMGIERLKEIKPDMDLVNKIKEVLDWRKIEYEFEDDTIEDGTYNFEFKKEITIQVNYINQYIKLLEIDIQIYSINGYTGDEYELSFSANPMKITFFRIGGKVIYEKKKEYTFTIEELGDLLHFAWSKWIKYITSSMNMGIDYEDYELLDKWNKQSNTDYKDLTEKEQKSDKNVFLEWFKRK